MQWREVIAVNDAISIIALYLGGLIISRRMAVPGMRAFAVRFHTSTFIALLILLALANLWWPFSGGGDDESYYRLVGLASEWADLASPDPFSAYMAQPGFLMLLNAFNLAFSPDLIGFKALNLTVFLCVIHTWMRILAEIEGVVMARRFALCSVLLTPLWFYFFFLLKDLWLALFLSMFVLGAVVSWKKPLSLSWWGLQLAAIIAMIPFRAPLAAQALAVLGIMLIGRNFGAGPLKNKVVMLGAGALVALAMVLVASSPEVVESFGVQDDSRVLGAEAMQERAEEMSEQSSVSMWKFPALYLLSDTAGFNPDVWTTFDVSWLRGVLALPWILFVVPMLPMGAFWLAQQVPKADGALQSPNSYARMRVLGTPWLVVVAFIATSALISWNVGDTTRWRIADMPALLAVGVGAWGAFRRSKVVSVIIAWCLFTISAFSLYMLVRGV